MKKMLALGLTVLVLLVVLVACDNSNGNNDITDPSGNESNLQQKSGCVVDAWLAENFELEPPQLYVFLEPEQGVQAIAWHMGYTVFYEAGNIAGGATFDSPHPSELLLQDFYSATLQLSHEQRLPLDLQFIGIDFNYGYPPSGDPHIISATRWRVKYVDGVEAVYGDFYNGETVELMEDVISILDDGYDYIYIVQPEWREGQVRWNSLFAFRVNSGINP